jgi:3-deoxy-D-manno-octulosonate 8-phosphate phosphatase (KDO 8-P phosphatase)
LFPEDRFKAIKMVLLDVDGVMTGGEIIYTDQGEQIKIFDVKDGVGIRMLQSGGIKVGIITGRKGTALHHRCENLGIDLIHDGARDKGAVMEKLAAEAGITPAQVAFIGDDLPDLSVMRKVGLAIAVADADESVRAIAHVITRSPGGKGAVREICETILKIQGKWDGLVNQIFGG